MTKPPSSHRRFDPWRAPASRAAEALLAEVEAILLDHERYAAPRKKTRRAADLARWRQMVAAVVLDLAWSALEECGRCVAIPVAYRLRPARYRHPAIVSCLPKLLTLLASARLAEVTRAPGGRGVTLCAPTERLTALLQSHGVSLASIGRADTRSDPLVLTRVTKCGRFKQRAWLDYAETAETAALRSELVTINAALSHADILFVDDGLGAVDTTDRWLSRRFVVRGDEPERFDRCGRLFGRTLQTLAKSRRQSLRISGEPVATLDYSSAFLRIALAQRGLAPGGDLYAIPGIDGLTRGQIKAAVSAHFFASPRMSRWPREFDELPSAAAEVLQGFPREWTPKRFRKALLAAYPALAHLNERAGDHLMCIESQIMVRLLLNLASEGIAAIPLHDAVLVAESTADRAQEVMEAVSLEIAGAVIPAHRDHS